MSFLVFSAQDVNNAAAASVAVRKNGGAVRVTNTTAGTIATLRFGTAATGQDAAAGDTAVVPGQSDVFKIPNEATHLSVLCASGRVNLAWGVDGLD